MTLTFSDAPFRPGPPRAAPARRAAGLARPPGWERDDVAGPGALEVEVPRGDP